MAVERLHSQDYEDLLDFIDQVFSQDLIRVHFQEDLPMLFGPDEAHMQMQYAYRDDSGKIRAVIGVIPYTYQIGEETFSARAITNVATHYRHTGKGYMQAIFRQVFADMEAEGVDFAVLHGNRERYRHMGFEMAGTCDVAEFQSYNIPNRKKRGETYPFTFRKLEADQPQNIRRCLELFNREGQHYVRKEENFLLFHGLWEGVAYEVFDAQGAFCGYLNYCCRFGQAIRELLLTCPQNAASVIYSFMQAKALDAVQVCLSPFDPELNRAVYEAAEYVSNGQTTRLNLLRPERFLRACLELKRVSGAYMPEGSIVIESRFGKLRITNRDGFTVEKTDDPADLQVPDDQIYGLFFGTQPRVFSPWSRQLGVLSAWFPMPFYIHNTDLY